MATHSAKARAQDAQARTNVEEFPNRTLLTPYLKKRISNRALPEKISRDPSKRWFVNASEFQRLVLQTLLGERRVDVEFRQCGVGTSKTLAQRMTSIFSGAGETQYLACRSGKDFRFILLAPSTTLRVLLDAMLGYSPTEMLTFPSYVERLNADALTPVEYALLLAYKERLLQLCPVRPERSVSQDVVVDFGRDLAPALAKLCDKERVYWEESTFALGERQFPWAVAVVAKDLLEASYHILHKRTETTDPGEGANWTTHEPKDTSDARSTVAARDERGSRRTPAQPRDGTAELSVKVATGEISMQRWRALKPGDMLYTDVDAQRLFTIEIDGVPSYRGKPGISQGHSAIQIKEKL